MSGAVEWRHDATTEPWLRVALLTGGALLYGAFTLLLAAALAALVWVLWRGSWTLRLVVVVLALVGGPFSLLYLVPAFTDPEGRPSFGVEGVERPLTRRGRVTLGVAGAAVLGGALWLSPALAAGLAGLAALAGVTYLAFATRGRLDPATATLETPTREFDLGRVTGYRARRVGPVAFVTLRTPNRPGQFVTPSLVRVPVTRLDGVADALEAVAAGAEREARAGRDPNPAVRGVSVGLAVLFLAVGAGALVVVDAGVGWYVALLSWLFAGIFLLVAREG
jgi:hypothetical protein